MPWIAISLSHSENELSLTCDAVEKALSEYAAAIESPEKYVKGHVIKPVFRKYN